MKSNLNFADKINCSIIKSLADKVPGIDTSTLTDDDIVIDGLNVTVSVDFVKDFFLIRNSLSELQKLLHYELNSQNDYSTIVVSVVGKGIK